MTSWLTCDHGVDLSGARCRICEETGNPSGILEEKKEVKKVPKKKKVEETPKSMYERLKELKFYHPGDESGEMFQTTCRLAYQMYGLGDPKKAELLYEWAKEQAQDSRNWCEQEGLELDDFITGDCY
jgi:hypothetical protein